MIQRVAFTPTIILRECILGDLVSITQFSHSKIQWGPVQWWADCCLQYFEDLTGNKFLASQKESLFLLDTMI